MVTYKDSASNIEYKARTFDGMRGDCFGLVIATSEEVYDKTSFFYLACDIYDRPDKENGVLLSRALVPYTSFPFTAPIEKGTWIIVGFYNNSFQYPFMRSLLDRSDNHAVFSFEEDEQRNKYLVINSHLKIKI